MGVGRLFLQDRRPQTVAKTAECDCKYASTRWPTRNFLLTILREFKGSETTGSNNAIAMVEELLDDRRKLENGLTVQSKFNTAALSGEVTFTVNAETDKNDRNEYTF